MPELFLGGGGSEIDSSLLDAFFAKKVKQKGGRVLYIPEALRGDRDFAECLEWFRGVFDKFGLKIKMLNSLVGLSQKGLSEYDAIYIGGGNTYYLLSEMKKTGADAAISGFAASGGLIYGGSAGAIILGEDISTSPDHNKDSSDFSGLSLLKGFAVWPHYTSSDEPAIAKYLMMHKLKVLALPERSGAYIRDGNLLVLGFEDSFIFGHDKKSLAPKGEFKL